MEPKNKDKEREKGKGDRGATVDQSSTTISSTYQPGSVTLPSL
jgi:hypothetical protein